MEPALSRAKTRAALMQALEHAIRRSSGVGAICSQTVADRAGLSSSDLECLDFLNLEGRVTAGRVAEGTGLTTGAITGVVDRLEKAGFVRRERDESDRRKVFIAIVPENIAKIGRFYQHMQRAILKDWETYSDAELRLLRRLATQGYKTMLAAPEQLNGIIAGPKCKRSSSRKTTRAPCARAAP